MNAIDQKDIEKYVYCMKEIKLRMDVIRRHLEKQWSTRFVIPDNEAVCIQFRKVLELIALASIAANKEEYARQHEKFANHWNGKRILSDLGKINPDFYPLPSRQIIDPQTGHPTQIEPIESGYLTREDFIKVYDQTSNVLHANNPYGLEHDIIGVSSNFKDWFEKIVTLLNHHQVRLLNADYELWVIMNADNTGEVAWSVMEKVPDPEA